ncbi:MAG: (Fe-S)-binding protein [Candidatus Methanomethylophilaceae archaeon]
MNQEQYEQLQKAEEAITTCTMCGFCKSVCPSFKEQGWDSAAARGRVILSYGLLQGDIATDESVIESIYTCTTCDDCHRLCPSHVDVVRLVELCRSDLVRQGKILPRHRNVVESILDHGNPYGEKEDVPTRLGRQPRKAPIGYFAGCTATYRNTATAAATISILDKLKADFTTLDEVCCGSVMQRIGWNEENVLDLMRRNVRAIVDQGVQTLVLSCAGCYRMFKEEYPKHVELPFRVLHISEFLAEQDLPLQALQKKITYHDPCHLGRHAGIYDAPRKVIAQIPQAEFQEMVNNRELSRCCGGGGGVRSAYPEVSQGISYARVSEAEGMDMIISTCPFCVNNLATGVGGRDIEVVDLTELVDGLLI